MNRSTRWPQRSKTEEANSTPFRSQVGRELAQIAFEMKNPRSYGEILEASYQARWRLSAACKDVTCAAEDQIVDDAVQKAFQKRVGEFGAEAGIW